MEKETPPKIPSMKHVLEDLCDPSFVASKVRTLSFDEPEVQKAYTYYNNIKQLEEDVRTRAELNLTLEELNQKLIENIASMKNQEKRG